MLSHRPVVDTESPGVKSSANEAACGLYATSFLLLLERIPPQTMGGIKKPERSGVWVAHRSFASGRPNETACGLHTASFASGGPNETVCGMHTASLLFGRFNEPVC